MTKEKVIDILKGIKDGTAWLMPNMPEEGEKAIDIAIKVVEHPEPHWIPVTERLPVEYDNPIELLCTLEDNDGNRYVDLILWTGCDWENNYTDDNEQNKYGIDKVVGWMFSPIPMRKGDVTK